MNITFDDFNGIPKETLDANLRRRIEACVRDFNYYHHRDYTYDCEQGDIDAFIQSISKRATETKNK